MLRTYVQQNENKFQKVWLPYTSFCSIYVKAINIYRQFTLYKNICYHYTNEIDLIVPSLLLYRLVLRKGKHELLCIWHCFIRVWWKYRGGLRSHKTFYPTNMVTNVLISPCIFLLIAYIIWHLPIVFYLKKNRMARCHAPFDKKNMAPCIADVPFFISSNDL
jgi:hypothetical protein